MEGLTLNRAMHPPVMDKRTERTQTAVVMARRGGLTDHLGGEGRSDSQGCQATTQLQNINLQWDQLATFRNFPAYTERETGKGSDILCQELGTSLAGSEAEEGQLYGCIPLK